MFKKTNNSGIRSKWGKKLTMLRVKPYTRYVSYYMNPLSCNTLNKSHRQHQWITGSPIGSKTEALEKLCNESDAMTNFYNSGSVQPFVHALPTTLLCIFIVMSVKNKGALL